ncbi:putative apoptosis-inducing taf9-like domain 1 family [Cladorrhinum samala]|uniref:Apoptosis-inducing taf9-like domain 1 family n=1 Tax=Cladorrhinum samala TaxID=585594 RepID=A0AAV9HBD2_9PEZI|nr:putative apoptosis-inducing taf9-like domain 1 family [Cladorrhinum samala]
MSDQTEKEEVRERLKSALWFAIGKIVDEESLRRNRNATPQFIAALNDVVWNQIGKLKIFYIFNNIHTPILVVFTINQNQIKNHGQRLILQANQKYIYIESVAIDLENFSRHAGRTTITTDDVLLLARRNQDLHGIIKDLVDKEKAAAATADNGDKGKGKRK